MNATSDGLGTDPSWQKPLDHFRRGSAPDFASGVASGEERTALDGVGRQAQDFLAWRRSLLLVALASLAVTALVGLVEFVVTISELDAQPNPNFDSDTYQLLLFVDWAAKVALAVAAFLAVRHWSDLVRSHRWIKLGWLVGFLVPFAIALVPVRWLFDLQPINPQDMANQRLLLELFGFGLGLMFFMNLLPAVLAVFVGAIRASLFVKRFMPESALPGWVASIAAPMLALLGLAVFVLVHQSSGSLLLLFGFACVIAYYLQFTRYGPQLARPQDHSQLAGLLATIRGRSIVFVGVGGICMLTALFSVRILGMNVIGFGDNALIGPLGLIKLLIDLIGKALFTALLFADLLVCVVRQSLVSQREFGDSTYATTLTGRVDELDGAGLEELARIERLR